MISYYEPVIAIEQFMMSVLVVCLNVNSIVFLACFMVFVLTLKYDLFFIGLNLQFRPDMEYFVDFEDQMKMTY